MAYLGFIQAKRRRQTSLVSPAHGGVALSGAFGRESDAAEALSQLPGPGVSQLLRQQQAVLSMPAGQAPPSPLPSGLEES